MLNVKKFRATTTREALELIKQDLGEDAFVLETKKVRTGGFLGIRSSMQVEVSAAAPPSMPKTRTSEIARPKRGSFQTLNLTDDTPATPYEFKRENEVKRDNLISALTARSVSADEIGRAKSPQYLDTNRRDFEPVEVSSLAPKVVHPKREMVRQAPTEDSKATCGTIDTTRSPEAISSRELELLRAELREVKFSMGAFANRQNAHVWQSDVDLDVFGEIFDAPYYDIYVELAGTGIAPELARKFIADAIPHLKNNPLLGENQTRTTLLRSLSSTLKFEADLLKRVEPVVLAVIGSTGVGKTTTIAKLAARVALYEQRRVELVTLDTYRIAAVEQLKTYAEIIGAGCHVVRSVSELDSVLRAISPDSTVLIDTTGRSPHDLADQYELSDYLRMHKQIRKCLAIQATTHPTDASAAIKKFEMYGADCLALTKMDETMRPGAVIETIADSGLPLAYFCAGQRVPEDLQIASAESLTNRILGKN